MTLNKLHSSLLPKHTPQAGVLRVATYNIHKGVRGIGPAKRLEIHNLQEGVEALQADLVFLTEVRLHHALDSRKFQRTTFGWPDAGQADFLAPEGYGVAYRTNCTTRHGEHGNALLARCPMGDVGHHDVSDHRFEQRGLLHVPVQWEGRTIHAVVAHFGLHHAGRVRQVQRLAKFIEANVPKKEPLIVAGDFNDWGDKLDGPMKADCGITRARHGKVACPTFPSMVPVFALDRIYVRGMECRNTFVPRGSRWAKMSDHLPLVAELEI